jgi:PilZ domain
MGPMRIVERRREVRIASDVALTIWGVDMRGERFTQDARARDISLSGALLSGLESELKSGDVVGIRYAGRKARFRVVWIRYDGTGDKMEAALHRFETDPCPWMELLLDGEPTRPRPVSPPAP